MLGERAPDALKTPPRCRLFARSFHISLPGALLTCCDAVTRRVYTPGAARACRWARDFVVEPIDASPAFFTHDEPISTVKDDFAFACRLTIPDALFQTPSLMAPDWRELTVLGRTSCQIDARRKSGSSQAEAIA